MAVDMAHDSPPSPLVLFDGECGLCNRSVQFIIRHDRAGRVKFAPLQSDLGQRLLREAGMPADYLDSVLLFESGTLHKSSDAALRTARHLDRPWRWLAAGRVVPRFLREPIYRLIARNRYRLFGKVDACQLPAPGVRERFVG